MKIKVRFIGFFTLGLMLFLLYLTMIVVFLLEVFLPFLAITDNAPTFAAVFLAAFVSGGALFSFWFVRPITAMTSIISEISAGNFISQEMRRLYDRNGGLKLRYRLYKELISDVDSLAEQLNQAETEREKLEQAKGDWVRGISHDLKTPLSYVVGYSALLLSQDHSWTQEEQKNFLSQIHQKGKYIESLINNMNLSFRLDDNTKPLPLQISAFDLIAFIENLAAEALNQQTDAEYPISVQSLDERLNIEADKQLLYRAVSNLIDNALRYNTAGTEITVIVKRNGKEGVNISVCDNGIGVPPETAENLFVKYSSANGKKDYAGGLGLSIVKNIVEAHNGSVSVENGNGKGFTFHICLPLKQGS